MKLRAWSFHGRTTLETVEAVVIDQASKKSGEVQSLPELVSRGSLVPRAGCRYETFVLFGSSGTEFERSEPDGTIDAWAGF